MILGNADCGSRIFSASFEKTGTTKFPKYEFRQLAASHPIYTEQYLASKWKSHPIIRGQSNGIRELMMLVPEADPGRAWQIESTKTREEAFQLAGNIFLYATGKENLAHKARRILSMLTGKRGAISKWLVCKSATIGTRARRLATFWRRSCTIQEHVGIQATPVKIAAGALADYKIAAHRHHQDHP